jgi:hypothetical protein
MATENTLSQQLLDLLATRNLHPEMLDRSGRPTDAPDAKTFTFDYEGASGKNYGTMVIVLDSDNEMKIMYGDNLGRTMEGTDKNEFFDFIQHLSRKATMNRWTHTIADISQLKHTMQGLAAIQEGLFEGYYGNRNISYAGAPTQARLKIKHSQPLGENDARFRHVESLFVETADGECFRLGFRNLSGGRAMLEHVRQGGKPYDIRGCHLTEMVSEIATLSRFNRASAGRVLEGVTQEVVSQAQVYYKQLRENLKRMSTARGYSKYFESWHPADITEQEELVENIKTLFVEQTIDTRIEQALPLLAKIQQGRDMKEAEIFESWINNLSEGTWNLPETPEQLDKLKTLMTSELIVGPDATNATEQLYDLVGDDILFDRLSELAARDPRANAWNDTEVMNRLAELGIQMPEPTEPGNPAEPQTAPEQQAPVAEGEGNLGKALATLSGSYSGWYKENEFSNPDLDYYSYDDGEGGYYANGTIEHDLQTGKVTVDYSGDEYHGPDVKGTFDNFGEAMRALRGDGGNHGGKAPNFDRLAHRTPHGPDDLRKTDRTGRKGTIGGGYANKLKGSIEYNKGNLGPKGVLPEQGVAESAELNTMLKYAGVPVKESVLTDSTGSTLEHIKDTFRRDVKDFTQTGNMSEPLYDALYDYYFDDMPYGTKKARDGDPYEWISNRFSDDIGLDEGWKGAIAGGFAGGALGSVVPGLGTLAGTALGAYAGHKLGDEGFKDPDAEYKKAQKLKQTPPVDEADAISTFEVMSGFDAPVVEGACNMTAEGSYCPEHGLAECGSGMYESREGDAVLARIKSLALIR